MATHDPSPNDTFEQRVQTLTRQAAESVAPAPGAWAEIGLRLRQGQAHQRRHWYASLLNSDPDALMPSGRRAGLRSAWGALSAVVVVSLLIGAFAWVIAVHLVGVVHPHPVSAMQATVNGVTIVVDSVYADPTRTLVTYHVDGLTTTQAENASITPILLDTSGHAYAGMDGSGKSPPAVHNLQLLINFQPLAPAEQATAQLLTFYVDMITINPTDAATQRGTALNGPWRIALPVSPHIGKLILPTSPPITHQGISAQLERVSWAAPTAHAQADANYGIVSVLIRLSGLPFDALNPIGLQTSYPVGSGQSSVSSPATATLRLANGAVLTPAFTYPTNLQILRVGISYNVITQLAVAGSMEVGISFLAMAPITPGACTLTLHSLQIERAASLAILIQNDWVFQVA